MNRSYLKWAGGKYNALGHLLPLLSKYSSDMLVEPFVGSGTVALNAGFDNYFLADSNNDLINCHRVVSNESLQSLLVERLKVMFDEGSKSYNQFRDQFNDDDVTDVVYRAALFIYLNKFGFNGLCRYNKSGKFNVPVGGGRTPRIPLDEMRNFTDINGTFNCAPYEETFSNAEKIESCTIYSDPPYVPMGQSDIRYSADGFSYEQQVKLKDLSKSSKHTCIISNHWNSITENLYSDADDIILFDVNRTISCKGSERIPVRECIVVYGSEKYE